MSPRILSLGWGVQSFTIAAMVALGELPPIDLAIHADTRHEAEATYSFRTRWEPWLIHLGVRCTVAYAIDSNPIDKRGAVMIPAFTISPEGSKGQIRRQCTQDWKIAPIRRIIRRTYGLHPCELIMGISLDEVLRMRDSEVAYITHRYPLVDKAMDRAACVLWLEDHGLEVPSKSACTFCPFKSQATWRLGSPKDRIEAITVDQAIRNARLATGQLFIHPSRKPFSTLDLRSETEMGQIDLFQQECMGYCAT